MSNDFPLAEHPINSVADVDVAETASKIADAEQEAADSKSIWPAFLGALIVFGIAILGMAVGAIFGNKPIKGSCGGIAAQTGADGESTCGVCSKPVDECPDLEARSGSVN